MKLSKLALSLVAALSFSAMAQNLAVVNGKPVPSSRVEVLKQQVERSGRPVTPEILAQIKEELIAREIFMKKLANAAWMPAKTTKRSWSWPVRAF